MSAPRSATRSVARLPAGALAFALLVACAAHPTSAQAADAPTRAAHTASAPALLARAADVPVRWVCRSPAPVFNTPGGIVIAILARGDRVTLLLHAADSSPWVLVRGPIGIRGWIEDEVLCG